MTITTSYIALPSYTSFCFLSHVCLLINKNQLIWNGKEKSILDFILMSQKVSFGVDWNVNVELALAVPPYQPHPSVTCPGMHLISNKLINHGGTDTDAPREHSFFINIHLFPFSSDGSECTRGFKMRWETRKKKKSPFWVYFVYISVNIENN